MTVTASIRARRSLGWGGAALLFVVLAGVLGMHGLNSHGVAGSHDMTALTSNGMPAHEHHARSQPRPDAGAQIRVAAGSLDQLIAPAEDMGSMTALCLAVLTGGVLLLLALRAARPMRPPWGRWLRNAPAAKPGRERDPPSLTRLSVCRC